MLAIAVLSVPALAGTAPLYTVTHLLPPYIGSADAWSINTAGHAAGESGPAAQAIAWLATGPCDLGYIFRNYVYQYQSHAYAINDSDAVVGMQRFVSPDQYVRGFYWTQATGMLEIVPPTGFGHSYAQDINNSGTVVGYVGTAVLPYVTQGFRWTPSGGMSLLGSMGGASSTAVAINSLGHIVGTADTATATKHLFLLKHDGPLNPTDDIYPTTGTVVDVNDADQVLLWDGGANATVWQNGQTSILPGLTANTYQLQPFAISNHGDVVGMTYSANRYVAFLFHNGVTIDLNTVLPANSGWQLTTARGINDAGQIVGSGMLNSGSAAFLLTPIVYGDANGDGKVDMADVVTMLQFGAGLVSRAMPPGADVAPNPSTDGRGFGDGVVDIQDAMRTLRYISGLETTWP
jgi:probable HAF family extracellular repeat protein